MSDPRKTERPVSRLLDIVVEEVSLVDRAANEHRFLIVKRSDIPMADNAEADSLENGTDDTEDGAPPSQPESESATAPEATPDPLLATAVAALEGLTSTVELLGSMGADAADARLAPLAAKLKTTAEALLARAGGEPAGGDAPDTESAEDLSDAKDGGAFAEHLASARAALTQLAALTTAPAPKPEPEPAPAADTPAKLPDELTTTLTAMGKSFRALAETVKEQQQRLARVEKQFGLPNSTQSAERVRKAASEAVGWPMDLNNPMDRESVDKAVSFHDV